MVDVNLGNVKGADGEKGNGIQSIVKTSTSGLVDTYTVTYDDDTTTTFTVTNGEDAHIQDFYADSINNTITLEYDTVSDVIDMVYPVGSIYMSVNSTSPSTLFGGTWVQLEDRFLLGAGTTYTAGDTGGEATHTLTKNEMPAHSHSFPHFQSNGSSTGYCAAWDQTKMATSNTGDTGSTQPHNNMPPYLVVYMWQRTE